MKKLHLIFGILIFVVFLLTGQYMDRVHNHLEGMDDGTRLLYRSRHIYILMAAMVHLVLGVYLVPRNVRLAHWMQVIGSSLLGIGTLLLFRAFMTEPLTGILVTPFTHWGMYLLLAGVILHVLSALRRLNRTTSEIDLQE